LEARRSPAEDGAEDGQVSLAGIRVLVVDDEPDARELLEQVLAGACAEVAVAASAPEALDALDRFRPDVLVSDIGLPGEDGYDLIRQARERGFAGPAAALTAFARAEDRRRALLAGFQIHLAKPVHPGELTAVVASLAERARTAS
ncbi:MAG TPA: response regulator, partial [Thermoanaerobaculia bacterium]